MQAGVRTLKGGTFLEQKLKHLLSQDILYQEKDHRVFLDPLFWPVNTQFEKDIKNLRKKGRDIHGKINLA